MVCAVLAAAVLTPGTWPTPRPAAAMPKRLASNAKLNPAPSAAFLNLFPIIRFAFSRPSSPSYLFVTSASGPTSKVSDKVALPSGLNINSTPAVYAAAGTVVAAVLTKRLSETIAFPALDLP